MWVHGTQEVAEVWGPRGGEAGRCKEALEAGAVAA